MSNDPKQQTPQQPAKPEPIGIKMLRFVTPIDLPGKRGANSVTAERKGASAYHELSYVPALGFYRVVYHSAVKGEPAQAIMVPRELGYWEPA